MRSTLKTYMHPLYQDLLGKRPTTHANCLLITGEIAPAARPGKTARDKARGSWKPNAVRKAQAKAKSEAEREYRQKMGGR